MTKSKGINKAKLRQGRKRKTSKEKTKFYERDEGNKHLSPGPSYESYSEPCPECGEKYQQEARVRAGMKCGRCAYGG